MALSLRLRDVFSPPIRTLKEAGIQPGHHVLDFGCGPGSFSLASSRLVGRGGKVYALDVHPLALRYVQKKSERKRLPNIVPISSDCTTGLPDQSVDVILLYDVFHELEDPDAVLAELARVLKREGILSFSDHHLKEQEIISRFTKNGRFRLLRKGRRTYTFQKS